MVNIQLLVKFKQLNISIFKFVTYGIIIGNKDWWGKCIDTTRCNDRSESARDALNGKK